MTPDEFFERTMPEPNSGCWFWMGAITRDGYGVASTPRLRGAHRLSYSLHCGEIPRGQMILHSCDQPCCVNPDHLRLGTHRDNAQDRTKRGRYSRRNGELNARARITDAQATNIRADMRELREIAEDYGVTPDHIRRIKLGTRRGSAKARKDRQIKRNALGQYNPSPW